MECGAIYLYRQQRRLVHPAEQEKVYMGQRISVVYSFLFQQYYGVP